jgi:hypothetical protein
MCGRQIARFRARLPE